MKKLLVAACLAAMLVPAVSGATMKYCTGVPLGVDRGVTLPGFSFPLPAMAQNDSAQCIYNVQKLYVVNGTGAAAAFTSAIMWGCNSTTGTDSFTVNVQGGWTSSNSGPWVSMYAGTLQANTIVGCGTITGGLSNSTPYVIKSNVANTTLIPFPYMRIQVRLRGSAAITAAQGKRVYVLFPQATPTRPLTTPN